MASRKIKISEIIQKNVCPSVFFPPSLGSKNFAFYPLILLNILIAVREENFEKQTLRI